MRLKGQVRFLNLLWIKSYILFPHIPVKVFIPEQHLQRGG